MVLRKYTHYNPLKSIYYFVLSQNLHEDDDKDCVEIIRGGMYEGVWEWFIIISDCFYTEVKAVA